MKDKQVIHWAKFMHNAKQGRYDATLATDDVTPATDEAIEDEFYSDESEPHYDDIPAWLEEDTEYKNSREEPNACAFCRREGVEPPATGSYATGSYRKDTGYGLNRPQPFRGHVCDAHKDDINWVSFKLTGE